MKQASLRILCLLLFFYGVMVVLAKVFERKLMYFPSFNDKEGKGTPMFKPWRTKEGDFLGYVREEGEVKRVIVWFHGNGGEALDRTWIGDLFPEPEIAIVLAEYPGYGAKSGTCSQKNFFEAASALMSFTKKRWRAPITLVGESLGSGIATYLASVDPPDRLGLVSPFSSAVDVGKASYPFLPVSLLMTDRYESVKYAPKIDVPVGIIHGTKDEVVPFVLGKKLFEAFSGPEKYFTQLDSVGHNDIAGPLLVSKQAAPFRAFLKGDP